MKILRLIKILFLLLVGTALTLMAFANWDSVTVELLHGEVAAWVGFQYSYDAPLFLVILVSIMVGILVGYVIEWLREHRYRKEAKTQRRTAQQLEREVKNLKGNSGEKKDDILALIDEADPAR